MNPPTPKRPAYCLFSIGIAAALFFSALPLSAQTVIGGDTIDVSAMLDVQGADKGVLLPRMTTAQRNAMPAPARGLLIFNNDENCIQINTGSPLVPVWKCLGEGLPQTGNQTGNVLYWSGTAWVRLSPGQPGQQLILTQQGIPAWTGATFPVVSTAAIGSVTHVFEGERPVFTAQVGGNVSSDGGGPLLGKGVVCSTDGNPSLSNHSNYINILGIGTGAYSSLLPGLSPGTTYTCKAYAFNSAGTAYGAAQTFTTPPQATATGLNCTGATTSTDLVAGKSPDGTVLTIPYTGGNGGLYPSQTVSSTGLTGLTASLAAGTLSLGPGSLQYVLTGTTPTAGTANFSIRIGGQSCTVSRAVLPGAIAGLDCAGATFSNAELVAGKAVNATMSLPYSGGNGGSHPGQTVASTGVSGLTATLWASNFADGSGTLTYSITGTPSAAGTANFALSIGGQSCTLSRVVVPGAIAGLDCAGATQQGELYKDFQFTSNSTIPYTGGNGGSHPGQTVASTGVTGLTATLLPGNFTTSSGVLIYSITGTPSGVGIASFALSIGGKSCMLTRTVLDSTVLIHLISMKNIPAGTFSMGCTPGDPDCASDESPVHTVTLSTFQIGETEVTQMLWRSVMGSNPSYLYTCMECPVEQVSWYDAVVFCNRLSDAQGLTPCYYSDAGFTQVFGKSVGAWSLPNSGEVYHNLSANGYRLPTEAEWEYAARGGSATNIYSGSDNIEEVAVYFDNLGYFLLHVLSAKTFLANGFGLIGMSGNAQEWCQDWYGSYSAEIQTNPSGASTGSNRVLRGGSFLGYAWNCRVSSRKSTNPIQRSLDTGFRLARSL